MKTYGGMRDTEGRCQIHVWTVGEAQGYALPHRVRHSPAGFEWGYAGSGPADTARSLLADLLGALPHTMVYQRFKMIAILPLPSEWTLTEAELRKVLERVTRELVIACPICADRGVAYDDQDGPEAWCRCAAGRAAAAEAHELGIEVR